MKQLIKKILGLNPKPDTSYLNYIDNKSSILRNGFSLRVDNPKEGKKYLKLGERSIMPATFIFESPDGEIIIGDDVLIGNATFISRNSITIEDHVFIGWGTTLMDHDFHSINYKDRRDDFLQVLDNVKEGKNLNFNKNWDTVNSKPILIKKDVWIGMNCTIMKGVTIGEGAVVAANSVVTKDVAPFTIVAGNPARVIKTIEHNK